MARPGLIDRRTFMAGAGAAFAAGLSGRATAALAGTDALFAAAFRGHDGAWGVGILTEQGKVVHTVALPARGHDVTFDPVSGRSVVFARQPGAFLVVFDHQGRAAPVTIASIAGRHFYGHGVFSPDGALLYATENDFDNAAGMVGVYDASDAFRRVGEFPTYGIGPHELLLLPDGRTLAVANGGIETHPDFGRAELNLATMQPSLTLVDRVTGDLVERHVLETALHQLSIRHMDIDGSGALWFGCQHRGPDAERPPLVGRLKRGDGPDLIVLPDDALGAMRNYVGAVAANRQAGTVALSSPQGNALLVLEAASGRLIARRDLAEVCGLASDGADFLATTGAGAIVPAAGEAVMDAEHSWDNHVLRVR
ncbi:MAG: DUF1513 domain-containing protein [Rhizobiaceae bacterium]